jgi:cbb3-type cytochrome oxidase maturation protein
MEASLYLLIPISVALVFLMGWVFWRALHGGQFDDLERPGYAILDEDEDQPKEARRSKDAE